MIGLQRIKVAAACRSAVFPVSKAKPEAFRLEVDHPDRLEEAAIRIVGADTKFDDHARPMRLDDPHRKGNMFQCRRSRDTTNRIVQFDAGPHNLVAPHRHRSGYASTNSSFL